MWLSCLVVVLCVMDGLCVVCCGCVVLCVVEIPCLMAVLPCAVAWCSSMIVIKV